MRNHIRRILCLLLVLLATLLLTACATTQSRYEKAQKLLANGEYAAAAEVFSELGSYEDATTLTMYSRACAAAEAGDYLTAITTLESMGDYKDCPLRVTYYTARAYEDKAGTDDWVLMLEAQEIYRTIPLFMDSQTRISALDGRVAAAKAAQYDAAVTAGESGRYSTAISSFRHLGSYQDSRTRITYYTIRQDADALTGSTDQDAIIATASRYADMGAYLDCPDRAAAMTAQADKVVADKYARVDALIAEGKYDEATALLNRFGVYGSGQIPAKFYAMGEHALAAGKWRVARDAYYQCADSYDGALDGILYAGLRMDEEALTGSTDQDALLALANHYANRGAYLDCPDRAAALTARADEIVADKYARIDELIAQGKYDEATTQLNRFGAYGNGEVPAMYYAMGEHALTTGSYGTAGTAFKRAGSYSDAPTRLTYTGIRADEAALEGSTDQDKIIAVAERYAAMGSHSDCAERAAALTDRADEIVAEKYAQVDAYIANGEYDKATSLLNQFGTYGYDKNRLTYTIIRKDEAALEGSTDQDKIIAVAERYAAMGSHSDCAERAAALTDRADEIVAEKYVRVDTYVAEGQYDKAISLLNQFGTYGYDKNRLTYTVIRKDEAALEGSTDQDKVIALANRYADMGAYLDCPDRAAALNARADEIVADKYARIDALIAQGKYDEATTQLNRFGFYGNGEVPAKYYAMGEHALTTGSYGTAGTTFKRAGSYSDAPTRLTYTGVRADEAALAGSTDQDKVIAVAERYAKLGSHSDCAERAAALTDRADEIVAEKYAQVDAYVAEGQYDRAISLLNQFGAYGYDKNRLTYTVIRKDEAALEGSTDQDKVIAVANRYADMGTYLDCPDRAAVLNARADEIVADKYAQVDAYIAEGKFSEAYALLTDFGTYGKENVPPRFYAVGELTAASGHYDIALSAYSAAGNYSDAAAKIAVLTSMLSDHISVAGYTTVGLRPDGTVVAVGYNIHDQCDVSAWKGIVAISAGGNHTVGLRADGTVVAVGSNRYGQCRFSAWKDIVAISAGGLHTVGLHTDGTVVAVGYNDDDQCDVSAWKGIVAISAGSSHTVGLRADGTVIAVGSNRYGQCDVSAWKDIVAISAGAEHTVGLRADGTVVAVGRNYHGQCNISAWKDIVAISAGYYHTVGLRADGTVVAVGYNDDDQCDVSAWKGIVAISAGSIHTVGLRADGTVVAVGSNHYSLRDVSRWDLLD